MARIKAQSDLESYYRDYREYGEIIDQIEAEYETGMTQQELTSLVAMWFYDQGEIASEERQDELKDDYDETVGLIAADQSWDTKEKEDDDDDQ
jgi:hypothetical protein